MYVDEARKRYEAEEGTTFAFLPVFEIAKAKKKFHVFCDKKPSRASLPKGTKKAKQEAQEADACSQARDTRKNHGLADIAAQMATRNALKEREIAVKEQHSMLSFFSPGRLPPLRAGSLASPSFFGRYIAAQRRCGKC
eukprot:3341982-Prorocentrum_lima.AAC.1